MSGYGCWVEVSELMSAVLMVRWKLLELLSEMKMVGGSYLSY